MTDIVSALNPAQEQALNRLFQTVHEQFPEIVRQEVRYSPEDKENLWLYVLAPLSEEREVEFINFAGQIEADILLESGYWLSLMPRLPALHRV